MIIKIEIPDNNKPLAAAIGRALVNYAGETDKRVSITVKEIGSVLDPNETEQQSDSTSEEVDQSQDLKTSCHTGRLEDQDLTTGTVKVDEKGVPFIPAICGEAKDPFYTTSPHKGQWKKKRNVPESTYNEVYDKALAQVGIQTTTAKTEETPEQVFGDELQTPPRETARYAGPQEVFELYSALVQGGKVNEANSVMQKHGLANGTLIYSRPDLVNVILPELRAL